MRKNANQGSAQFYLLIAIVLGIITFFEFAFVEWQGLLFNNDGLILWSLYILSIIKFFLVVMFFMHLWGDHKLLTQLFTAGMVVGSITVAIMLMLFTADNMNRYKVEQPVSAHGGAHGGDHGGGHGDAHGPIEIPERSLAETLSRPAPKSQQYALAPRENLDAGSLNLPSISLPAIDQGVLPAGNSSMEPVIMETTVAAVTSEPLVQEVQVVETVTTEVAPATVTATAPAIETEAVTTTTTSTTTTEVVTTDSAASDDLMALRAQVEALRLELEAMENALPAEAATTVTTPVVTETVTTTVTQDADTHSSAQTAAIATTAAVTVGAAATAAVENISASTTPAVVTEVVTETATVETATVETASVSFDTELGNSTYMNCLACHQMTGEGIPGAFPPLKGHMPKLYNAEGGRDYLIQVVLYGLQGEIVVDGMTYNGLMTPWGSLDDDSVAAVLNHELTSWGNDALLNDFSPITAEEVAVQRATPLTAQEVLANRVIQ